MLYSLALRRCWGTFKRRNRKLILTVILKILRAVLHPLNQSLYTIKREIQNNSYKRSLRHICPLKRSFKQDSVLLRSIYQAQYWSITRKLSFVFTNPCLCVWLYAMTTLHRIIKNTLKISKGHTRPKVDIFTQAGRYTKWSENFTFYRFI